MTWLWRFPSGMMAVRNFRRHGVRSALASLGIVIGVLAIASLGMVGASIEYSTTENLDVLTNKVTITAGPEHPEGGVTAADVRTLEQVAVDEVVVPQKTGQAVLAGNRTETRVSVVGVTRASVLYSTTAGEVPDRLRSGALLSSDVAADLGLGVGEPVRYGGTVYRIRGIVELQGFGGGPLMAGGGTLVLPLSAFADQKFYDTVTVVAADGQAAGEYADRVEDRFNSREEVLAVTTLESVQDSIQRFLDTLNIALLGIGSISLFVASVAILNVMLMSTIERRGEIGLLRAVGIRRMEVLRMILAEAALLGLVGAVVGVVLSLGVGLLLNDYLFGEPGLVFQWNSLRYLLYGFGFGIGASLLSGLYPAWKAANDPPVEALRG